MKTLIFAGNYEQFKHYIHKNLLAEGQDCFYAERLNDIIGRRFDKIEVTGTFWDKENAGKLYDEAQLRITK